MQLPQLTSKRVGVPFWAAGGFGNKLRTWGTLQAFEADGCPCDVGLRYTSGRGGRGPCEYYIPRLQVAERVRAWIAGGCKPELITICEMAPDHRLLINGELSDNWHFFHSRLKLPMREALAKGGAPMYGLQTRYTLRTLLTPSSWEDLIALIDLYPDHVIELSVYDTLVGDLRGRNMIPWEVRKY
jgi:hypothetical protein